MKNELHLLFIANYKRQTIAAICLVLAIPIFLLNSCIEDIEQEPQTEDITVEDLLVADPLIWNTLASQSIGLDDIVEKSASLSTETLIAYPPADKYYYALFEDLYPAKGDYDFNDIVLKSKLYLGNKNDTIIGRLETSFVHRGGSKVNKIGIVFYETDGKNSFKRIANNKITINGELLSDSNLPYNFEVGDMGENWIIEFGFEAPEMKNIWVSYFVLTQGGQEILTAGFAEIEMMDEFELPKRPYLTADNKPWGLEIEAKEMPIVVEKENFCKAFPDFVNWVNNAQNEKYKKWYENPDDKYIQETK